MTYLVAQICLNGHIITDAFNSSGKEKGEKFCSKCGAETITKCMNCETNIRGRWVTSWQSTGEVKRLVKPKSYCHNCGIPYPWIVEKQDAMKDLINDIEDLSTEDKEALIKGIPDILAETPRTEETVGKFKKAIKEAPKAFSALLYKMFVDISSKSIAEMLKT